MTVLPAGVKVYLGSVYIDMRKRKKPRGRGALHGCLSGICQPARSPMPTTAAAQKAGSANSHRAS